LKKHIAILFLLLYLTPTLGVTVSWSQCNERSMKENSIAKCVCKPGKPNKECCDNKKYTFKFKDSQQKTEVSAPKKLVTYFEMLPVCTIAIAPNLTFSDVKLTATTLPRAPNIYKHPIYLLNQVFRI